MAFLTGEERPPLPVVAPQDVLAKRREAEAKVERITDELLMSSMGTIRGVLRFADLPPDAEEPPAHWVEQMGAEEARKQFQLARYGLMSSAQAPVALKLAAQVATGILKSRNEKTVPSQLNVQFVQFNLPPMKYPSRKVEK